MAVGSTGLTLTGLGSKSFGSVLGAIDKVNFAVVGLHGRGKAHVRAIAAVNNTSIGYVCDVDSRVLDKAVNIVKEITGRKPKAIIRLQEIIRTG